MKTADTHNIIKSVEKKDCSKEQNLVPADALKKHALFYREAAAAGDPVAQVYLGHCYQHGWGVKANYNLAVKWYRRAADQHDPEGEFFLALAYQKGTGIDKNDTEATKYFIESAKKGNLAAMFQVAVAYQFGLGIDTCPVEALKILHRLAEEADYAKAQFHLALTYLFGQGTAADRSAALYWFEKAAEQQGALPEETLLLAKEKIEQLRAEGYSSTWVTIQKDEQLH